MKNKSNAEKVNGFIIKYFAVVGRIIRVILQTKKFKQADKLWLE